MTLNKFYQPQMKLISWIRMAILIAVFMGGWRYGYLRAANELPQLSALNARYEKLHQAVFTDPSCMKAYIEQAQEIKLTKTMTKGN